MAKNKKNKKKRSDKIYMGLLVSCMLLILAGTGYLAMDAYQYLAAEAEYDELENYTVLQGAQPDTTEPDKLKCPIDVDFDALRAINKDVVGWIYLAAEDISYPVVQGTDNEHYLHYTYEGKYAYAGSIFVDSDCHGDFSDATTIVYGHAMADKSMFGKLKLLSLNEDIKNDDTFWIITPEKAMQYKIFNLGVYNQSSFIYMLYEEGSEEFVKYCEKSAEYSSIQLEHPEFDEDSKVVILSTCFGTGQTGQRYAVSGVLINTIE